MAKDRTSLRIFAPSPRCVASDLLVVAPAPEL